MNHFTLGDWTDFVRQLKDPATAALMQQHLDESCQECSKVVRMWRDLLAFGSKEKSYCPPDRALRSVLGYYGLLKTGRQGPRIATMARLILDSLLEPVPAGTRSPRSSPRQLLYSAGDLLVDLRLEHRSRGVSLVGQAQSRVPAKMKMAGIAVLALKGTEEVAQTACNQFGEFQFDLESKENDSFSIVLQTSTLVVISLPPLRSW
jgi:hypothetical protein